MAAHLARNVVSLLDVRVSRRSTARDEPRAVAPRPEQLHATRIAPAGGFVIAATSWCASPENWPGSRPWQRGADQQPRRADLRVRYHFDLDLSASRFRGSARGRVPRHALLEARACHRARRPIFTNVLMVTAPVGACGGAARARARDRLNVARSMRTSARDGPPAATTSRRSARRRARQAHRDPETDAEAWSSGARLLRDYQDRPTPRSTGRQATRGAARAQLTARPRAWPVVALAYSKLLAVKEGTRWRPLPRRPFQSARAESRRYTLVLTGPPALPVIDWFSPPRQVHGRTKNIRFGKDLHLRP